MMVPRAPLTLPYLLSVAEQAQLAHWIKGPAGKVLNLDELVELKRFCDS